MDWVYENEGILDSICDDLLEYKIVDSEEDGYDLACEIAEDVKKADLKSVKECITDYLIDVYGYNIIINEARLTNYISHIMLNVGDIMFGKTDL